MHMFKYCYQTHIYNFHSWLAELILPTRKLVRKLAVSVIPIKKC